jgi:hypothetical protein
VYIVAEGGSRRLGKLATGTEAVSGEEMDLFVFGRE